MAVRLVQPGLISRLLHAARGDEADALFPGSVALAADAVVDQQGLLRGRLAGLGMSPRCQHGRGQKTENGHDGCFARIPGLVAVSPREVHRPSGPPQRRGLLPHAVGKRARAAHHLVDMHAGQRGGRSDFIGVGLAHLVGEANRLVLDLEHARIDA